MKSKVLMITVFVVGLIILPCFINSNIDLRDLEKEVSSIVLPEGIEKVVVKSAIGDSGGNGSYSTLRVVLVIKTEMTIDELKQDFENMKLKFPKHYESRNNIPIYYITNCQSNIFKSSRDFSLIFDELAGIEDYNHYYFIEFVE